MVVPSWQFLVFGLGAALVFNLLRASEWRSAILLVTNLLFLASFSHRPLSFAPFAGFLLLGYLAQHLVRGGRMSRGFAVVVIGTVALFAWLKRYSFFPHDSFLPFAYLQVGLSYVFFRVLHLIIDSHQDAIEQPVGPVSYLNYTLNFASLVAGPIQRYQDYRETEANPLPLDHRAFGFALERIVTGCFKVMILSMLLGAWQRQEIAHFASAPGFWQHASGAALIVALYPLYLFCNFSGYVDVVIGVARLFRLRLPENFDRPFSATNFIAFWARWHMTLSNWLRTYVYNPLMLMLMGRVTDPRLAPFLAVIAFFVTFFLVGIWHGQSSEFVFFGVRQGGGVAANKLYQVEMTRRLGRTRYRRLSANGTYTVLCRGLTFTWFGFTLLWFWSNWNQMAHLAAQAGEVELVVALIIVWLTSSCCLALWERIRSAALSVRLPGTVSGPVLASRYVRTSWLTMLAAVSAFTLVLLNAPAPEIVYKAF